MMSYFKFGRRKIWSILINGYTRVKLDCTPILDFNGFVLEIKCNIPDDDNLAQLMSLNRVVRFSSILFFGEKEQFQLDCFNIKKISENTLKILFTSLNLNLNER